MDIPAAQDNVGLVFGTERDRQTENGTRRLISTRQ